MISDSLIMACSKEERDFIINSLVDYNLKCVPSVMNEMWTPIEFIARSKNKEIIGGLLAGIGCWGALEIKTLWIREDQRKTGLGSNLLKRAEEEAISQGATLALVDTFDFQAKDFYLKHDYIIFGELNDFPKNYNRYYFSKKLK